MNIKKYFTPEKKAKYKSIGRKALEGSKKSLKATGKAIRYMQEAQEEKDGEGLGLFR